jgi:competence protein ComEC
MKLERVELFSNKKELLFFALISLFILTYSLLIEYKNYKQLIRFDSAIIEAQVIKQYEKTKNNRTYWVMKLKSINDFTFYTTAKISLQNVKGKTLKLEIFPKDLSFYDYFTQFYAYSKIIDIKDNISLKNSLNSYLDTVHDDSNISSVYKALYTAHPLKYELQKVFSSLGVSHLLAISGFHLGVLSGVLYFILTPLYKYFQNRFPYRSANLDIFLIISIILFSYLMFLESPPSLLRAYAMLIVGFVLYDRYIKIISMQTLFVTAVLLLVFFPRLFFSLGFWLSVSGVFYIFLFLIYFSNLSKIKQFILLPIWIYIMMLPFSVIIFGNFSIYHPLSIIWTTIFSIFYPLSILLHLIGFADIVDGLLKNLITLGMKHIYLDIDLKYLYIHIFFSIFATYKKSFLYILLTYSIFFSLYIFVFTDKC